MIKWEHVKKTAVDLKKPDPEKDGNGKRRKWEENKERENT